MPLQPTVLDYVPIMPDSFSQWHKNVSDRRFLPPRKSFFVMIFISDHPFSTYAKFSEKLTFLTP